MIHFKLKILIFVNVLILLLSIAIEVSAQTAVYGYTGGVQTYVMTSASVQVTVCGAAGGPFTRATGFVITGGQGGCVTGILSSSPGSTLYVLVGGVGGSAANNAAYLSVAGGWNGGGNGRYAEYTF